MQFYLTYYIPTSFPFDIIYIQIWFWFPESKIDWERKNINFPSSLKDLY